jgi:tRNA (guanosine-2'-O-)-methyltransferase
VTPERIEHLHQVLSRRRPDLTVVTDFVHKQRNLSAIVRNCDAVVPAGTAARVEDADNE